MVKSHIIGERFFNMKKFLTISLAFASTFAMAAQQQDPTPDAATMQAFKDASPKSPAVKVDKPRKVLLFTKTSGYRHYTGIVGAKEVLDYMGKQLGIWEIVASEDIGELEVQKLKEYDAVVLCHTTGDFIGKENSAKYTKNLMDYVQQGGGIFAIHAGVDCYNHDGFRNKAFTDMLGGEFIAHPWGNQNAPETIVIDDNKSPITKGIWESDGFRVVDEIYMVGSSYNRATCRVLMRIDPERSPVTTDWGRKIKQREDGDLALVWIKKYGNGRVAYGGFCHDWSNYKNPKFQELYMRLLQFVCGDLKADTSSLPFVKKSVCVPMCEKPTIEEIKNLSNLKYGEADKEINSIIFGVYANNLDRAYCKQIEKFVDEELKTNNGTALYRGLLSELLWATTISEGSQSRRLAKYAKACDDDAIKSRLGNATAHFAADSKMPFKNSKHIDVPSEKPANSAQLLKVIRFLGANKSQDIPAWLTFEAIDETAKAHFIYALVRRGENLDGVFKLTPQSSEVTIAMAYAAAHTGNLGNLEKVLAGADFIDAKQRAIVASYLASIKSDKIVEKLFELLPSSKGNRAALIIETATRFDLNAMVSNLFNKFESKSNEMKLASLKAAESISNREVFMKVLPLFVAEKDAKVKNAMSKTLLKSAQNGFDSEMFGVVKSAFKNSVDGDKPLMMRFAAFNGSQDAIEICKDAYRKGLKEEAIKAFGYWNNQSALEPLMAIAKATKSQREKTLAQMSMIQIGGRAGMSGESVAYIIKNAVRGDEKDKAVELAIKYPSPEGVAALESLKMNSEADKARENLKKIKTSFKAFNGSDTTAMHDGNINSRWSSNSPMKKGDWFAIDFGYPKKVSQITFKLGSSKNDFPNKIDVLVGANVDSAQKVDAQFDYNGNIATVTLPNSANRVVKIVCAENKPAYWWSIHEIEIK